MSIRRMMLFTLGGFFKSIIALFKARVLSDAGNFEAENNLENQLNTIGSTLFDSASLVITPNGVKTSKLYSIKPSDGTGDLSVTRATTATRINESGVIVDVPANVARIDYSTGQPAILVELQRTNLVYPSATATTQVRAVTAQVYTLSFYGTGTVTLSGAFSGSLVGTGADNRVSLTFTPTAGNLTLTVSGTVTNWQLEAGSYATSLIKTVSGSVTRNADVISKSGISSLIGQTEGTIFFEYFHNTATNAGFRNVFSLEGNVSNQFNNINFATTINENNLSVIVNVLGVSAISGNSIIIEISQGWNKVAFGYNTATNGTALYLNGNLIATRTLTGIPSMSRIAVMARLNPYSGFNTDRQYGSQMRITTLFPTRLSNTELAQLTTL